MKSKIVLIAYQDDFLLGSLSPLSSEQGYQVEATMRMGEITRRIRGNNASVILLDDELEGIKAHDLALFLKRLNPRIQIIAISSMGTLGETKRLREAGIFYQAMKPVDLEEVRSAIACAFDKIERERPQGSFFQFLMTEEVPV